MERAKETIIGMAGYHDSKVQDLKRDTVDGNSKRGVITTDAGVSVSNTDDWLKLSTEHRTGPMLLEDQIAREKIMRFDHERIPERVVHARGSAAFGHFKLHESVKDVSCAGVLTDTSRTTPVFVRFSTVLGSRGSADTVRDVRGFAVKFYTEEGNWDIVGNDIPVFFIQDAMKFPDVIHAGKPEPHNEVPQSQSAHNNFWDFQYLHSEATHMFMWAMSDRGIPRSYRMMQGFGVNTYRLVNKEGASHFVKFHFTPTLGVHSLVWDEALKICGQDPDFHRKDLWEAIESGAFPTWKFGIQVLPESKQDDFEFDILDATKIWPEELVPVRYIGELQLNRNPDEFFTQTEQVAFCTSHVIPGVDFSDDPLLQGRNFSYFDTQLSRLGINWQELPINRPICPMMNNNRDGAMRHRITKGTVNYWPNRFEANPPAKPSQGGFVNYPEKVDGVKQRLRSKKFQEHIGQAQLFYNSLSGHEKAHLTNALAFELDHCDDKTVYTRIVDRLTSIDLSLAQAVATKVGGTAAPQEATKSNPGHKSGYLSQTAFDPKEPTIATRRIAIIVCNGYNASAFTTVRTTLKDRGAFPYVISTRRSAIHPADAPDISADSSSLTPDHHFEGMRSTLFDAILIPDAADISSLRNGRVIHWIREAFGHCKAIGAIGEAVALVKEACGVQGVRLAEKGGKEDVVNSYGVVTTDKLVKEKEEKGKGFLDVFCEEVGKHRCWAREMDGLTGLVAY
ncbi:hypothetical protein GP486_007455 [Trichoglossum hirsutum]|uniref:Catalase n=1 Tax=Trichoglossum hirsutum TaxID=265104 RepID=A0A9P8IFS6_9PEZI|nr:hypothetical protein GP486_007455 [Trichoglossum hirsutum]